MDSCARSTSGWRSERTRSRRGSGSDCYEREVLGSDGLGWHRFHGRRDVLSTALAPDHDALRAFCPGNMQTSIGEQKTKVILSPWPVEIGRISTHIEGKDSRISGVPKPIKHA
jgi:hypothetical protein